MKAGLGPLLLGDHPLNTYTLPHLFGLSTVHELVIVQKDAGLLAGGNVQDFISNSPRHLQNLLFVVLGFTDNDHVLVAGLLVRTDPKN